MKKIYTTTAILLTLSLFNPSFAKTAPEKKLPIYKDYSFPLKKANGRITGSFAEHRGLRLHAGLDFSTDNKKGYEVVSVADAVLHRIKTSHSGYGKALYLKLSDGNIAVYAHLDEFSDKINKILKPIQKEKKSFWIDTYITEKIKIAKGEVIGLSGDSGGTAPHLHFETRNSADIPFNLLAQPDIYESNFYQKINKLNKTAIPLIENIFLIPLDKNSYINGSNEIFSLKPYQKDNTSYYLKENIAVFGKIAIAVYTYEDVTGNKIGPGSISLSLNDKETYSINLNYFNYSQYNYGSLIYSLNLKQAGFKNTFLLMKNTDYTLPLNDGYKKNAGEIDTNLLNDNNPVKIIIKVKNSCSEKTVRAFFTLHKTPPQIIQKATYTIDANNKFDLQFNTESLSETAQVEISVLYKKDNNNYKTLKNIPIEQNTPFINFTHIFKTKPELIRLTPRDKKGALHTPYIINLNKPSSQEDTDLVLIHANDRIEVNMLSKNPPMVLPTASFKTNNSAIDLDLTPATPNLYSANIYTEKFTDDITDISIILKAEPNTDEEKTFNKDLKLYLIRPENNYLINSADNLFYLKIEPDSFFNNTYITTEILTEDFVKKYIPEKVALTPASKAYKITPNDLVCKRKFNVGIKANQADLPFLGVYYLQKDKWVFDGKRETGTDYIESRTLMSGVYCLLKDSNKPIITNINPIHDKKDYVKIPKVSAIIYDKESGLNKNKTELWLNGEKCAAEYDSNTKTISYTPEKLISGINTAEIKVTDNIGNQNTKAFSFGFKQEQL